MGTNKKEVKAKPKPKKETKPSKEKVDCADKNCPFHSNLKLRGRTFIGTVIKARMNKTVTVEWPRQIHLPKYERYEKRYSKVKAHKSPCIHVK